jgi:hypothetical protein
MKTKITIADKIEAQITKLAIGLIGGLIFTVYCRPASFTIISSLPDVPTVMLLMKSIEHLPRQKEF